MHCELSCRLSVSLRRDFPNFYQKLYNLLEPSVLHAKYRARFFHLADLFLSSRSDHDTVFVSDRDLMAESFQPRLGKRLTTANVCIV